MSAVRNILVHISAFIRLYIALGGSRSDLVKTPTKNARIYVVGVSSQI